MKALGTLLLFVWAMPVVAGNILIVTDFPKTELLSITLTHDKKIEYHYRIGNWEHTLVDHDRVATLAILHNLMIQGVSNQSLKGKAGWEKKPVAHWAAARGLLLESLKQVKNAYQKKYNAARADFVPLAEEQRSVKQQLRTETGRFGRVGIQAQLAGIGIQIRKVRKDVVELRKSVNTLKRAIRRIEKEYPKGKAPNYETWNDLGLWLDKNTKNHSYEVRSSRMGRMVAMTFGDEDALQGTHPRKALVENSLSKNPVGTVLHSRGFSLPTEATKDPAAVHGNLTELLKEYELSKPGNLGTNPLAISEKK